MLKIHEILDRYEILYPDNTSLTDLRRSYIDKDMNSMFRIIGDTFKSEITLDDLRKLSLHQNYHSLFRIIDNEDLRQLIVNDNIWALWKLLDKYQPSPFTEVLKRVMCVDNVSFNTDCFARNQLKSKKWIIDTLEDIDIELGNVFLCAGWYATLATMLFNSNITVNKIYSIDLDPETPDIAKMFNQSQVEDSWRFQAVQGNIMGIDYTENLFRIAKSDGEMATTRVEPDTIINTSCEHIENFGDWWNLIPNNKLVILQSNDFFGVEDHVNCSESLAAFSANTPMTACLYSGELKMDQYTRFMRIGFK